jgi:hypothetical protein
MGFEPNALRKLQSCLVAAEAACSRGDFPVVAVEIALAAVVGFATTTETAAVPVVLAAVVAEPPKAINGAAQPPARQPSNNATPISRRFINKQIKSEELICREAFNLKMTSVCRQP